MKKIDLLFILGVAAVITLFVLLPSRIDRNAKIPLDSVHKTLHDPSRCLTCHAPDAPNAMNERHPKKDQCFGCHRFAKSS